MALYYNLPVYKVSYTLITQIYECSSNFVREYKYTLGQQMKDEGATLIKHIYRANKAEDKVPHIEAARENLEMIRLFLRLMQDAGQIGLKKFAALNLQIDMVSRQLIGWEKSCKKRSPEALPESPVVRAQASEQSKSNNPLVPKGEKYRSASTDHAAGRVSGPDKKKGPAMNRAVISPPAAGNCNHTSGAMGNVGSNGNYWSSSVSGTNAHNLNFNASGVNPANANNRANGFSVRCLKDLQLA